VLAIVVAVLLLVLATPAAGASSWQRPVDGDVLRAFLVHGDPYGRGQHRGVDLAAARGSPVRSACTGRVSFAGRVPGGGRTLTVRCGAILATYQQLAAIAVRRGEVVARGAPLGAVGASVDRRERRPHVHLGARDAATGRYIDPLRLLGAGAPPAPLLPPAPSRRAPPSPIPGAAPPRPAPAPALPRAMPVLAARAPRLPRAVAVAPGSAAPVPWVVWAGLAATGLALPVGGVVRLRGRRRRTASRVTRTA
jgi:hypothetical protein